MQARVQFDKLEPFGFQRQQSKYVYREKVMEDQFEVVIEINAAGQLSSYIWDCEMEEVYTAHLVTAPAGAFVGQVREAYKAVLDKVKENCYIALPFSQAQSNRLAQYIKEQWGDLPDYPFAKLPEYGTFRHPANGKWYALIGQMKRSQLGGSRDQSEVEIINLKVDHREIAEYLSRPGIFPAYHMSKKNWVTIVLDGTVSDEDLFVLLAYSRQLVGPKSYKSSDGPDYWVIPANPKLYDIDTEFAENPIVYWPQKSTIATGDFVAIYVTAPVQAIRYFCRVRAAHLPADDPSEKEWMQVEMLQQFPDDVFPREKMMELGVKAVRGPRRMTKELIEYLQEKVDKK